MVGAAPENNAAHCVYPPVSAPRKSFASSLTDGHRAFILSVIQQTHVQSTTSVQCRESAWMPEAGSGRIRTGFTPRL